LTQVGHKKAKVQGTGRPKAREGGRVEAKKSQTIAEGIKGCKKGREGGKSNKGLARRRCQMLQVCKGEEEGMTPK